MRDKSGSPGFLTFGGTGKTAGERGISEETHKGWDEDPREMLARGRYMRCEDYWRVWQDGPDWDGFQTMETKGPSAFRREPTPEPRFPKLRGW